MSYSTNRLILALSILTLVISIPAWVSASELTFEAEFEWRGPGRATASAARGRGRGRGRGMKLVIASAELASIMDGEKSVALCRIKPEDTSSLGRAIASIGPKQVDFECEAAEFAGLTGPATLIFKGPGNLSPLLRFGTWLDGYRKAPLKVTTDHLSSQPSAANEVPARSAGELAKRVQRKPAIAFSNQGGKSRKLR
ncbi:MAG TPA: hypothetical protein VM598_02435 [Bdellovibrionota bacterium]|nr:hypothetical protein [Bdellovibrionota bacterium]